MERSRTRETLQRRPLHERLSVLEDDLAETERRLDRLENTFADVFRETEGVSIGGPCRCGEGLLVVRAGTVHCPACRYRRAI